MFIYATAFVKLVVAVRVMWMEDAWAITLENGFPSRRISTSEYAVPT